MLIHELKKLKSLNPWKLKKAFKCIIDHSLEIRIKDFILNCVPWSIRFNLLKKQYNITVEQQNNKLILKANVLKSPVYIPEITNMFEIKVLCTEQLWPSSWHKYLVPHIKNVFIGPNDHVIDCGAADGIFSMLISNKCKKLFLIEPVKSFVDCLKQTFENYSNVEIIDQALGENEDKFFIEDRGIYSSVNKLGKGYEVNCTTLDKLFYEKNIRTDFIKADLEGYELNMLKGAQKCLEVYGPKLAITVYHNDNDAKNIINYVRSINPKYQFIIRGITRESTPSMLFAWVDKV